MWSSGGSGSRGRDAASALPRRQRPDASPASSSSSGCRRRAEVRRGGEGQDQERSFLATDGSAARRSVASQRGSNGDRAAPSSFLLTRDRPLDEAGAGAARPASSSLRGQPDSSIEMLRSRANRGIGRDGQVADGEVVHPVSVRMRPCSRSEQPSSTGDVSTSSSAGRR